ncbi:hypothetical protein ACLBXM_21775, partial [Xanthobacteraceae bacterium A53D]
SVRVDACRSPYLESLNHGSIASANLWGHCLADVKAKLAQSSFSDCRETRAAIVCSMDTANLVDTVSVGLSADADPKAYALVRHLRLKAPMARQDLAERMSARYRPLVDAPGGLIAASESCRQSVFPAARDGFSGLQRDLAAGTPGPQTIAMAQACDFFSGLSMGEGSTVEQVSVVLFAGQPLRGSGATNSVAGDIRF